VSSLQTYEAEGLITHQDLPLVQYDPERRYIKLEEQEIEVRRLRAEAEVQILEEEKLQARTKDLCNRFEPARQKLKEQL
jgi:hypothetical protein